MSKVKKINVEVSYLKSLPNYENVRFTAGAEVEIKDGDIKKSYQDAWNMVGEQIEEQLTLFSENNTGKVKKGL